LVAKKKIVAKKPAVKKAASPAKKKGLLDKIKSVFSLK
jgi:hypothetical protein